MKSIFIFLYLFAISQSCFANFEINELNDKPLLNKKSKKNYELGDVHYFSFINVASGKYYPKVGDNLSNIGAGIFGRWDWIMPEYGKYAYTDGVALFGSFINYYPSGGFLEGGYGWMFGKSNKKATNSTKLVKYQTGMGIGFGLRSLGFDKKTTTSYGGVWPEFAAIVNVGNRLTVHPKYSFFPMLNNGLWGMRSSSEILLAYRLIGWFGLSTKLQSETMFFNKDKAAWNGPQLSGKGKFKSFQVGISIHLAN